MPTMMPEIVGAQQHHGALLAAAVAANAAAPQDAAATRNASVANSSIALSVHTNATASASVAAADAEAREWWAQREAKVERELYSGLLKRMDTQRKQVIAFKAEQSKWENRLQVKIKKDAHDRKLLGEYNIELQAALSAFEDKFARQQRDVDAQTTRIIALESLLHEKAAESVELAQLRQRNEELTERVAQWERFHRAEAAAAKQLRHAEQEELLNHIEYSLLATSLAASATPTPSATTGATSDKAQSRRRSAPDGSALRRTDSSSSIGSSSGGAVDEDALLTRIAELEKLCKQKDQTIHSLKSMFERQEVVLDEKLKLATAKYAQVKAINVALQKRLLESLTETPS